MAEGVPDFERGGDQPPPEQVRYQQLSARVPEHVSRGVFSTGALVMTGANEFVLDFVLRAMRPHQIVARVVLPHAVMPQLLRVLNENIQKYQQRFGPIAPLTGQRAQSAGRANVQPGQQPGTAPPTTPEGGAGEPGSSAPAGGEAGGGGGGAGGGGAQSPFQAGGAGAGGGGGGSQAAGPGAGGPGVEPAASGEGAPAGEAPDAEAQGPAGQPSESQAGTPQGPVGPEGPQPPIEQVVQPGQPPSEPRRPSVEEIYNDLKLPDELLSGVYANAVMISHSPGAFSFDFLTSFYPRSSVSARVFLPAPHVPALLDSMTNTWQHLQVKLEQARQRRRENEGGG